MARWAEREFARSRIGRQPSVPSNPSPGGPSRLGRGPAVTELVGLRNAVGLLRRVEGRCYRCWPFLAFLVGMGVGSGRVGLVVRVAVVVLVGVVAGSLGWVVTSRRGYRRDREVFSRVGEVSGDQYRQ